MEIAIDQEQGVTIISLNGELQRQTAPGIQRKILPLIKPDCKILLDLGNVSYMSSAGLRLLLLFYRQIEAQDGSVALARLQETVRDTMSITGFLEFFTEYNTIEEGISVLNQ
ncbi:MAG: anti-sigma B factor antagonist [Chloroflexi bacterium]|nr:MAG: anti-sigma B factor antagonist [Chloroflexota bacterium]